MMSTRVITYQYMYISKYYKCYNVVFVLIVIILPENHIFQLFRINCFVTVYVLYFSIFNNKSTHEPKYICWTKYLIDEIKVQEKCDSLLRNS